MAKKIIVKNLADYPKLVPLVSKWMWRQWSKRHKITLKEVIYRTKHCLGRKIPQTLIAFYSNKPVGTVSLWPNDYAYRKDLTPWLSVLFVLPKYRGLGIGRVLQTALLKTAKKVGFKKIYLMTELKNYYQKTGWRFLEIGPYTEGRKVSLYEYKL